MDEFQVPAEPGDLWDERSDLPFKVLNLEDLSEGSPEEVGELAEGEWAQPAPMMLCSALFLCSFYVPS